jgi:hypothetical protein
MRIILLLIGIILIIASLFFYFTGDEIITQIEAYNVAGIPISEFIMYFRPDIKRHYELAQLFILTSKILGITGSAAILLWIISSKKEQSQNNN